MKLTSSRRKTITPGHAAKPAYRPGYLSVRKSLAEGIKLQTGLDVTHLTKQYFGIVDRWVKTRGKRDSVLRLKDVYLLGLRSIVDDPIQPKEHWISVDRTGFPRQFQFLKEYYLRQNQSPQAMQAVLSILGYYRAILAPGTPDFSSITSQGPRIPASIVDEIFKLGLDPSWNIRPKRLPSIKLKLRSKRGPNGQATVHAFTDLSCLDDKLIEAMKIILSKSIDEDNLKFQIPQIRKRLSQDQSKHHSRLAIKREKGGKDRVFAMVDYWTQIILEPLHHGLSDILRKIPEDATFDQGKGQSLLKQWSLEGNAASLDLSNASDRIPATVQKRMLEILTGDEEFASAWMTLMVDREFYYKGKTLKWVQGQPLGAHSSWPSFALLHHIVMRAAHQKCGIDPKGQYYILGDDMAARDSEAITKYREYLDILGIAISDRKGLQGNSVEFAKRIFHKGYEVSPLPVQQLESVIRDTSLITEFLTRTRERSSVEDLDLRMPSFLDFISCLTDKDRETLAILAEYPIPQMRYVLNTTGGSLGWEVAVVNWNNQTFPYRDVWRVYNQVRFRTLIRHLDALTRSARETQQKVTKVELPSTPKGIQRMHPLFYSFGNYFDEVEAARAEVRGYLASSDRWPQCPSLCTLNVLHLVKGSKASAKHSSAMLLEVWKILTSERSNAST